MKKIEKKDIALFSDADFRAFIEKLSPEEIQEYAPEMTISQIQGLVLQFQEVQDDLLKAKWDHLINGIVSVEALEAVGRTLNLQQLLDLLDLSAIDSAITWKLFPIFVAMPHSLFSEMLFNISEVRKQQLQQISVTEPLQHHLLLFIHEIKHFFERLQNQFIGLHKRIQQLEVSDLNSLELNEIQNEISGLQQMIHQICSKIENALSLAWYTNSTELIEILSGFRERYERFLFSSIGQPSNHSNSSGIYLELENRLNSIFEANDEEDSSEALEDGEPAIEALARLGIWYIEDYWHLGLLPKVADPKELVLPLLGNNTKLIEKYRKEVESHLSQIGLKTVKDLKQRHLVSKSLLKDFIQVQRGIQK